MKRIKRLNLCQKALLVIMLAMALVFAALYSAAVSRVGFAYRNAILVPEQEGGSAVYSGKIQGQPARFTVSQDRAVVFELDGRTYGPYTAEEDPAAIPQGAEMAAQMTGVLLRQGNELLFRGGVMKIGDTYLLLSADGSEFFPVPAGGSAWDEAGQEPDLMAPSAADILALMDGPTLTHKGAWPVWFAAVFLCALDALMVLFADELFRWNLKFQIRDPDRAEPSDWEIAGRYLSWTILLIAALVVFLLGLH